MLLDRSVIPPPLFTPEFYTLYLVAFSRLSPGEDAYRGTRRGAPRENLTLACTMIPTVLLFFVSFCVSGGHIYLLLC